MDDEAQEQVAPAGTINSTMVSAPAAAASPVWGGLEYMDEEMAEERIGAMAATMVEEEGRLGRIAVLAARRSAAREILLAPQPGLRAIEVMTEAHDEIRRLQRPGDPDPNEDISD
jgi:hypothetical protein